MASQQSTTKDAQRRNSQKNHTSCGHGSDKFRATKLWKQVIREFRERISESNHNNAAIVLSSASTFGGNSFASWRGSYNGIGGNGGPRKFSGAEAVEILTSFLTEKRESFGLKEVTEEKAAKFCEILLRDNTIASVPENKNQKKFEPTKNSFYFFNDSTSSSSLTGMNNSDGNKDNLRRFVTPKSCRNTATKRTSTTSLTSVEDVGDLDEKIVRDFALSRLLTLVDIPILEGILHMRSNDEENGGGGGGGSMMKTLENLFGGLKLALHRNSNQRSLDSLSMSDEEADDGDIDEEMPMEECDIDPWVTAAAQCLKLCRSTSTTVETSSSTTPSVTSRESAYRAVLHAYKTLTWKRGSLISRQYDDVLKEIAVLVTSGKADDEAKALEACQCLCLLLAKDTRDQLGALLNFVGIGMEDEHNGMTVNGKASVAFTSRLDTFGRFILPKDTPDLGRIMQFFLQHASNLLICPKDFKEQVYYRQTVLMHSYMEPKAELTFCKRISSEEYQNEALTATEQALFDALTEVVDDDRMSDKEKCKWFEKFRLEYPKIYDARFPSLPK